MVLLLLLIQLDIFGLIENLHSNMVLLLRNTGINIINRNRQFTFQYGVTITGHLKVIKELKNNLHSNMVLLLPGRKEYIISAFY